MLQLLWWVRDSVILTLIGILNMKIMVNTTSIITIMIGHSDN